MQEASGDDDGTRNRIARGRRKLGICRAPAGAAQLALAVRDQRCACLARRHGRAAARRDRGLPDRFQRPPCLAGRDRADAACLGPGVLRPAIFTQRHRAAVGPSSNKEKTMSDKPTHLSPEETWKYAERSMAWHGWGSPVGLGFMVV